MLRRVILEAQIAILQNFDIFEKLVGKGAFQNVILVTTKWIRRPEEDEERRQLQRENELKTVYWKEMLHYGSILMRHDGSYESARLIVLHLRDKARVVLQHQHEHVKEGKSFDETNAGRLFNDSFEYPAAKNTQPETETNEKQSPVDVGALIFTFLVCFVLFLCFACCGK